jgi:hypothetical protein
MVEKGIGISYPIGKPINEKGYHKGQESELTTSDLGLRQEELSNQPLGLFAREGARLVLAVALEEEIAGFLQRQKYERRHGNRRGYSDIPQ